MCDAFVILDDTFYLKVNNLAEVTERSHVGPLGLELRFLHLVVHILTFCLP